MFRFGFVMVKLFVSFQVCYGGIVPKELYKNRDDFFPPGIPPKQHLLGRSGTFSVGFSVPDSRHVIQY